MTARLIVLALHVPRPQPRLREKRQGMGGDVKKCPQDNGCSVSC
jgi:hypothetical protein